MIEVPWRSALLMATMMIVAAVLAVFQLPEGAPGWLAYFRPFWLELWALYWVVAWGGRIGMLWLLPVGVLADVLVGTPLGLEAALMVLAAWVGLQFGETFCRGPLLNQVLVVPALFLGISVIRGVVLFLLSEASNPFVFLGSGLTSALCWMLLVTTLRSGQTTAVLS